MASLKNNIRSFRFSDRVATILNTTEGNSMNERFENLVRYCYEAVPARQRDLQKLDEAIEDKRRAYHDLCKQLEDVRQLMKTLESVQYYGQIAARKAEQIALDLDHRGLPKEEQSSFAPKEDLISKYINGNVTQNRSAAG